MACRAAQKRATVTDTVQLPRLTVAWLTPPVFTPGDADSLRDATQMALTKDVPPDPAPFAPDDYFSWLLGPPQ